MAEQRARAIERRDDKMKIAWLGLIGLFGFVLVGCSQSGSVNVSGVSFDSEQIAQGQQLYAQ